MKSFFRSKRSSLAASPVDSIWAVNAADAKKLKSAISRHATSNARADRHGWIALVGGRNFGCREVEATHGYRNQFSSLPAHQTQVIEGMSQLKSSDIVLLLRMIQRKTPTPLGRIIELAGSDQPAGRLVASGIAFFDTNRKQERVYSVHANLKPSIQFEIERRSYVWELACRYAQFQQLIAKQLAQFRASADILSGYEISATSDSCDACKQLARKRFRLSEPPPLPHVGCTHPKGCRCSIIPLLKNGD